VTYFVHGATLGLAWFFAVNVALSVVVALLADHLRRSASWLLAARLMPAVLSAGFVVGIFLPSYWRLEPRDFAEDLDFTLTILAAGAIAVLATAFGRGAVAWWGASRRARSWTNVGEPLALEGVKFPAFRIEAAEPVMALAGILRPRLIVTRGLIEALTSDELAASLEHEIGHYRAWDNLKRLAMRAAPDVLRWMPAACAIEREWAAASERRADAVASITGNRQMRLALASALVKVARLMPVITPMNEPISTLVGGGEIAARVQCLIDDSHDRGGNRARCQKVWCAVGATVGVALLGVVAYGPLLEAVHRVTEMLVRELP